MELKINYRSHSSCVYVQLDYISQSTSKESVVRLFQLQYLEILLKVQLLYIIGLNKYWDFCLETFYILFARLQKQKMSPKCFKIESIKTWVYLFLLPSGLVQAWKSEIFCTAFCHVWSLNKNKKTKMVTTQSVE